MPAIKSDLILINPGLYACKKPASSEAKPLSLLTLTNIKVKIAVIKRAIKVPDMAIIVFRLKPWDKKKVAGMINSEPKTLTCTGLTPA